MEDKNLIVIITYNSGAYIEDCLLSLLKQDDKNWFLVVVDNNSSDQTVKKIRHLRKSSKGLSTRNFKLEILPGNIGFSGAVDHAVFKIVPGIKKIRAKAIKYLILLNPDIVLEPDALRELARPFEAWESHEKGRSIGVSGGLILDYGSDRIQHLGGKTAGNLITTHIDSGKKYSSQDKDSRQGKKYGSPQEFLKSLEEVEYVTGAFFATRLYLFTALGGFDTGYRPAYFEELDYCIKARKLGFKIVVNSLAAARHFEGASVKKFSKNFYKYYHKNRIRCAIINLGFRDFLKGFLISELKWLKNGATKEQIASLLYGYFLNTLLLPFNLIIKLKNHLFLNRLGLK